MLNKVYQEHRSALPGPEDITRQVLPNGIIVLTRSNFNSPTISIKGYLHTGSFFDPDDKMGLSYLTAFGLMTGTGKHELQALYNEIESVGARIGFASGTLTTSFSGHSLSEDLHLIMGLIAESLRSPTFPNKEFNRQKNQLLTGLAIRAQDTSAMAGMLFDQIIYAGHPYARPEEGFPETVRAIQTEDIIQFYKRTYGPKNMVIAIVGAVDPSEAIDAVQQTLGDWQNDFQEPVPQIPPQKSLKKMVKKSVAIHGKFQADIILGGLAPERSSPDYLPLRLGNNILGEFGMMGRLGKRVREEEGLAYYAYSSLSVSNGPGAWEMIAGVNRTNIDQTITLIREEIRKFTSEPVSKEELADTKSYYLGQMPLILESNSGVAISLLNMELFNLGLNYFHQYPQKIEGVTADAILQISKKYLDPDRLAVAIAGP